MKPNLVKPAALLLVLVVVAGLAPILLATATGKPVIVEIVFSRPVTNDDIAEITSLGGRIIYRLDGGQRAGSSY